MMKKVAFLSATVAMLVLSGCSSKEPAIDATANGTSAGTNANAAGANGSVISPVSNANVTDANGANGANGSDGSLVSILFDYDKFDIRADMQDAMTKDAGLLKGKAAIKLEGNCDEFGSDEYNFALGLKRANSVKSALVNSGISADAISMTSLGESNPVCLEKTKECWQKNRRVDFKLP